MNLDNNANRLREARIRWRLLQTLQARRANQHGGWVTGRHLHDVVCGWFPADEQPDDEQHTLALLRDLANKGFILEEDNREDRSQPFTLTYITFKITAAGSSFVSRSLPADADIDDGRIVKTR